jgi:hypothetical protein
MSVRAQRSRPLAFVATLVVAAAALSAGVATAADSPNGDRARAWPSSWRLYLLKNGALVRDVIGDVGCGKGYCDVSSGGSGTAPSVYFAFDGTNVFFRLRVKGDPRSASHGGIGSTAYVIQIAVNNVPVAAVGLDGKSPHRDFVYVSNAAGTSYTEIFATPFNNAGGERSAGARGLPDGTGHYFLDFQAPLARITQRSGGKVTATSPIQLFFGTSQSANLAVINKDYMVGNSVDFNQTSTVTFALPPAATPRPSSPPARSTPPPSGSRPPSGPSGNSGGPSDSPSGPPSLPNTATEAIEPTWILPVTLLLAAAASLLGIRRLTSVRA